MRKKPEKNNNFSMIWKSTFSILKKLKERKNKISKSITGIFSKWRENYRNNENRSSESQSLVELS